MYKISYMGNGTTTEFSFNFPYFENSNVVVTKNGVPATGYNIVGVSGGTDADIPFTGGTVVFDAAPSSLDSIIITRKLPLSRIADYQPTTHVKTTTLNQDLNYLTELLKDRANEMESLYEKYAEIADKESTEMILARMDAMQQEILALGNVSAIRDNITSLNTQAADIPNKLNKTLDNLSDSTKRSLVSFGRQFTNVGTIIVNGNTNITGDHYLGFSDDNVKIGVFSCYLQTLGDGQTTMAVSTDVMNGTVVATTNNGFTTSDLITIPFINKISVSFPVTTADVSSASIGFVGWM